MGDKMIRKLETTLKAAVASMLLCAAGAAHAQAYPDRPVTVVVPYAAGGNLDVITRVVTTEMSDILGQPFVVENRPGAGGSLGLARVAKSDADGYTLAAAANGGFAFTPRIIKTDAFAPTDFAAVGMFGITPLALEVPAESRFQSFDELVSHAKQNPRMVSIGHAGHGTTNHVAILLLQSALDIEFNVIPYKGSAPALNDVLGEQIDAIVDQIPSSLQHLQAKSLRALAVTSQKRAADLPEIPTVAEQGVAGFDVVTASGLLAPAGVDPEIINTLNRALNEALQKPSVRDRLISLGTQSTPTTPAEFDAFLQSEISKAEELDRQGLLQVDQ